VKEVARELVADGLDSAGGYEYLRQPTDLVVLGKIQLTPAARGIQVQDSKGFGGRLDGMEGGWMAKEWMERGKEGGRVR
jgi:hypothetical protein